MSSKLEMFDYNSCTATDWLLIYSACIVGILVFCWTGGFLFVEAPVET